MFVCTRTHVHKPSECTRNHVHEHLQLVLRSLQDLDQRRVSQKVLVQSALDPQRLLPKNNLDNQEPGLNLNPKTQRHWEENILQLKEQVRTLKSRDAGLLSQIRDLDRQILQLRLDTDLSHDASPRPCDSPESSTPDSRPSSGFYDLSDGPSLSNSVFSLCSALDLETTPISPVTPPPAAEASPLLTDMSGLQALLQCSLSSSVPSPSSAHPPSSAPPSSAPSSPPSSSAPLFSSVSSSSAPYVFSAPLSSAPPSSAPLSAPSSSAPLFSSPPSSFYPSSSGPLSPPSPSFSPSCLLESSSPPPFSPPPLSPVPPPPLSHLDRYILSLLNGRSLSSRPSQPRTTKLLLSSRSPKGAVVRLPMRPPTESNEERAAILGPDAEREARKSRNRSGENLTFNREPSAWRERREVNILRSQRRESRRHKTRRDKNNCTFKCRALKPESEEDLRLKQKTELCCGDKMIHRRSNMDKSTGQRRTFKSDMSLIKNNKLFTLGSKNNIESGGREREEQRGSRAEESRGGTTLRQRNQKRRRRRRSGAEEEQEDRASLRSCSVRSWRWSLVKSRLRLGKSESGRAVTSQEHICRRPIREEHCSEETGSEGERTGMGGARRQHLVRIKASQNLKKRIQKMKSGTFTLMTTV